MRAILAVAAALLATGAMAQEKYTDADLDRIYVPGAYTNEDLKALPPIEIQPLPALPLVAPVVDTRERDLLFERIRSLEERRASLARELEYEEAIVRRTESAGGNPPEAAFHTGYRVKSRGLREALRKEIVLIEQEIEQVRWHAVRASVVYYP